jgi:SAM-dependent methyltransferase
MNREPVGKDLRTVTGQKTGLGDFTPQAESYVKARPGYPPEILECLLKRSGVQAGDSVIDLGAGTGLFTGLLTGRGLRITALEPNEAMRMNAPPLPEIRWLDGSFEATGLPDNSADWVVAAQAFHWADPLTALPEIRRILRPGKAFSILWNDRQMDGTELLREVEGIFKTVDVKFDQQYRSGTDWGKVLVRTGDFRDVQADRAEHVVRMTCPRFLDLWRSHNRLSVSLGPEGMKSLLEKIGECLDRRKASWIDMRYTTRAWTAFSVK